MIIAFGCQVEGNSLSLFRFLLDCSVKLYCLQVRIKKSYCSALPSGVEVPLSILGAEIDRLSPPALVKEFEEALNAKSEVWKSSALF